MAVPVEWLHERTEYVHNYETEKITRKARDVAEYIELFGSSTRDRHARWILWTSTNICVMHASCMAISGGRTEQFDKIAGFLLCHWLYEWFLSAKIVCRYMHHAWQSQVE